MLDGLELGEGAAELLALAGITHGELERVVERACDLARAQQCQGRQHVGFGTRGFDLGAFKAQRVARFGCRVLAFFDLRVGAGCDQQRAPDQGHDVGCIAAPGHAAQSACEARAVNLAGCVCANRDHAVGQGDVGCLRKMCRENGFRQRGRRGEVATCFYDDQHIFPGSTEPTAFFVCQNVRKACVGDPFPGRFERSVPNVAQNLRCGVGEEGSQFTHLRPSSFAMMPRRISRVPPRSENEGELCSK